MTTNVPVGNRLMVMDAASEQNERTLIELTADRYRQIPCTLFKSNFTEVKNIRNNREELLIFKFLIYIQVQNWLDGPELHSDGWDTDIEDDFPKGFIFYSFFLFYLTKIAKRKT